MTDVTDADREAAASLMDFACIGSQRLKVSPGGIRAGYHDDSVPVQDFARHREASIAPYVERLEPVLHWYQSDEHEPRDPVDILRDVVADLQNDRSVALKVRILADALRPFAAAFEKAKEKAERMEEFGMGPMRPGARGTWGISIANLAQASEAIAQIDALLENG